MFAHQIEATLCAIAAMDRLTVTQQLLGFRGPFPIDFTAEYLDSLSLDRLRHVFAALCLNAGSTAHQVSNAA